MMTFYGRNMLL